MPDGCTLSITTIDPSVPSSNPLIISSQYQTCFYHSRIGTVYADERTLVVHSMYF